MNTEFRRKARSLFATRTMIGVYVMSFAQAVLALRDTIEPFLKSLLPGHTEKIDAAYTLIAALITLSGGITTASGRVRAGGVYTPKGLPGPDPDPS